MGLQNANDATIYVTYLKDGEFDYYVYDLSREDIPVTLKEIGKYRYINMELGLYHE